MSAAAPIRSLLGMGAAAMFAAAFPLLAYAAVHVDADVQIETVAAHAPRLDVDVWTNKEEGGVYQPGEGMRVFFRANADAFVLIYNIDTDGNIHLVYPYGPHDPDRVEGGRTYQVPSRNDPYDLVADGPTGMEYVVAIASPSPFRDLPWYLTPGNDGPPADYDEDDYEDSGVIVGDPYVGMDRILRRCVPDDQEDDVATADTYFYIERKVDYPRYVCADCHAYGGWYDPYVDVCSVVDIRIDASWARFRPLRSGVLRPRFFYTVRSTAPSRYRQWKDRWSSVDGRATLRTRFQVDGQDKFRSRRELIQRRMPPEFQGLRRTRAGRTWYTPEEVLRRRNQNQDDARRNQSQDDPRYRARGERQWQDNRQRRQDQDRQIIERRQDEERQLQNDRERRLDRGRDRADERRQDRGRDARQRDQRPDDRGSQGDRGQGGDRGQSGDRGRGDDRRRDDGNRGRGDDRRRDDGDRGRGNGDRHRDDGNGGGSDRGDGRDRGR